MIITQNLKDIRIDHEESQQQIADIMQITRQQYQLYESGKRSLPIDLLKVFCQHYKVSADYILGLPKNLEWPR